MPLCASAFGPFDPFPGNGPAVSAGIRVHADSGVGDTGIGADGGADGGTHEAHLGDGCIDHPVRPVFFKEAFAGLEGTAGVGDVLAEEHDRRIFGERVVVREPIDLVQDDDDRHLHGRAVTT